MPQWKIRNVDNDTAARLARDASLPEPIARILVNRGITNAKGARAFLNPSLSDLHDPLLMHDMDKAIERLRLARERREKVLLFGDYDVDGVTATAAMGKILESLGLPYAACHPDRLNEGYGFNSRGVKRAIDQGCSLIFTLDCGTEAIEPVAEARSHGIDVIVIDHHIQKGSLAPATAIVNPKKHCCPYPFEQLVTAGLILKFARAFVERVPLSIPWDELLQLAALGTVADVAPLREENRVISILGLEAINRSPLPGLSALADAAAIRAEKLTTGHFAFQLGPRINAAGRLGNPELATQLLLETDRGKCRMIADELNRLNGKRQAMEKGVSEEAIARIEGRGGLRGQKLLVVEGRGWHRGVVGIVAARIVEKYYRPAVVIAVENGMGHGSARSIPRFDLFGALCNCKDLFSSFGGHRAAAGLSLPEDKIDLFRERINAVADKLLSEDDLVQELAIDDTLPIEELGFDLLLMMEKLEPFGLGNPRPVLASMGVRLMQGPRLIGRNRDHIKMKLGPAEHGGRTLDCVGWRMAGRIPELRGGLLDVAYVPQVNEWRNVKRIQLVLKDIRPAEAR